MVLTTTKNELSIKQLYHYWKHTIQKWWVFQGRKKNLIWIENVSLSMLFSLLRNHKLIKYQIKLRNCILVAISGCFLLNILLIYSCAQSYWHWAFFEQALCLDQDIQVNPFIYLFIWLIVRQGMSEKRFIVQNKTSGSLCAIDHRKEYG